MWIWIAAIGGGLVGLVALVALIGCFVPRDHVAITAGTFRAAAERLFDAITDHAGQMAWRSGVSKIERGPDRDGKPVWVEHTGQGPMPIQEVEAVRPSRVVGRIVDEGMPFGGTWTFELAATPDGGTRVTITEAGFVRNLIFRALSPCFSMTKPAETYLRDLGTHVGETITPEIARAR